MPGLLDVLLLVLVVTAVSGLARHSGVPGPVLLVFIGIAGSYVPGVPTYALEPDVVLVLVLPPLLYSSALSSSLVGFRANLRAIGLLSVGYVLFTVFVVGLVAHAVVPGLPLAAAFTLGALVAPPDAVAASAVARRVGLPRRILTVLEGESLVNDATALTAYRVAVAAVVSGGFSWGEAVGRFALASVGGVVAGVVVAELVLAVRRRIDDPLTENAISLLTPFLAFLPAQALGASGVLAVVVTGLLLGHTGSLVTGSASRLQAQAVWRMIDFLLEGVVFLLIGLQLRSILGGLGEYGAGELVAYAAVVVAVVIVSRFVWVFPGTYLPRLSARVRRREAYPTPQGTAVVAWAGMRGVVSLAAAFAIPERTAAGGAFPDRDLLLFLTFAVILGTLVLQGGTLAPLIRRLGLRPDPVADKLAAAQAVQRAVAASMQHLDGLLGEQPAPLPAGVEQRLRDKAQQRALGAWERLGNPSRETPTDAYRRLRMSMLRIEREVLVRERDSGTFDDDLLREAVRDLDYEESLLRRE